MPGSRSLRNETRTAKPRTSREGAARSASLAPPPLEERTRLELYELATELGIAGRSDMSKAELIESIRRR